MKSASTARIWRDKRERWPAPKTPSASNTTPPSNPMADLYVIPSKSRATITVSGTEHLDWSVEQVLRELHKRKLLQ